MDTIIPYTGKKLITSEPKQPFCFNYRVEEDTNKTIEVHNPNEYAIDLCLSLNAGSGDTNTSGYESARRWDSSITYTQYLYSNAGRAGNSLALHYKDKLLAQAGGGAGTKAGVVLKSRTISRWTTRKKNVFTYSTIQHESIGAWINANVAHDRGGGESVCTLFTLPPKESAFINITSNNATAAPFKGSFSVSGYV